MEHSDFLDHLHRESGLFRSALADTDPGAPVPGCPEWTATDLLDHMAGVQRFWAGCLENRPAEPTEDQERRFPGDYAASLASFDEAHERLMAAFEGLSPDEPAWTWSGNEKHHNVGFIGRRQALEALVHRVDAEQAAGAALTPLDPALAADGVDEVLDVMYGGCPPWGEFAPLPHYVRFDLTDADRSVWVQIGRFHGVDPKDEVAYDEDDIRVVDDPGVEPDAVVAGAAQPVLLRLWRRGDGSETHLAGDLSIVDHFRRATHAPIN